MVWLGSVRLIKAEDCGNYYVHDAHGDVKLPDFRMVDANGMNLLVEVKSVAPKNHRRPWRFREKEIEAQERYAVMTGARLLLAHYWSAVNTWTLVDSSVPTRRSGWLTLDLQTAAKASELGLLGDRMIGTRAPLVFRIFTDERTPQRRRIVSQTEQEWQLVLGRSHVYCAGEEVVNKERRRAALFLMLYGGWEEETEPAIEAGGDVHHIDFTYSPIDAEALERDGFAIVGFLSSMYSTLYNAATLTNEGGFRRLRHEPAPGMVGGLFESPSARTSDGMKQSLPLWYFQVEPSLGPLAR
jgi:hypothetical protein